MGGERKRLTILFSDIAWFTSLSIQKEPEETVEVLREYLTEMTRIIFAYDGRVDKFMGDGILAIFGAPISHEDHALRGMRAAIEMQQKTRELVGKWVREGKPAFQVRMG